MRAELFLSNWSDILGDSSKEVILDYDSLLSSDDEFLILESILRESGENYEIE